MPLVRSGFVAIPPGQAPGFDHADVYRDGSGVARLYVAHTGADQVEVIDCQTGTLQGPLPGHPGVAGVLVDAGADLLFTSDRAAAQVSIYRCSDEKLLSQIEVGPHPNGLAFDPARGRLFSFNLGEPVGHNCTASVVDLSSQQVIKTINLDATLPLPGAPDVVMHDPDLHHLYIAIGDPGVICVANTQGVNMVETVATESGAHTLAIDPVRHAVYAFLPASSGAAVYLDE